jgi:hypothetical protein
LKPPLTPRRRQEHRLPLNANAGKSRNKSRKRCEIDWLLFTFFIFSRKERLIGMVDGMTQKEIFGEIKRKEILMFKVKEN